VEATSIQFKLLMISVLHERSSFLDLGSSTSAVLLYLMRQSINPTAEEAIAYVEGSLNIDSALQLKPSDSEFATG
jgi:hypothetical protein